MLKLNFVRAHLKLSLYLISLFHVDIGTSYLLLIQVKPVKISLMNIRIVVSLSSMLIYF